MFVDDIRKKKYNSSKSRLKNNIKYKGSSNGKEDFKGGCLCNGAGNDT